MGEVDIGSSLSAATKPIELHLFSDASNDAFAIVAYLVCCYLDKPPSSCLIASKSRVSPVKRMTIPQLELMGDVLSSCQAQKILKVITIDRVMFGIGSVIKAKSTSHLLPTELAKFSELQVLRSGDTYQEQ